jgi:hypothetical protein
MRWRAKPQIAAVPAKMKSCVSIDFPGDQSRFDQTLPELIFLVKLGFGDKVAHC